MEKSAADVEKLKPLNESIDSYSMNLSATNDDVNWQCRLAAAAETRSISVYMWSNDDCIVLENEQHFPLKAYCVG